MQKNSLNAFKKNLNNLINYSRHFEVPVVTIANVHYGDISSKRIPRRIYFRVHINVSIYTLNFDVFSFNYKLFDVSKGPNV